MKLLKIKNQDSEIRPREEWPNTEEGQLLLDVYQDEKNIYIKSTIAGVNHQDLEIALHNDMLTIKGSRKSEMELEGYDYFFQECYWGDFSRSIILPVEVESAKIGAELKNGVLKITIPKSKKRRKIPIKITE